MKDMLLQIEPLIPALRRYARALPRGRAAADDLVQDCLERAVSRWHRRRDGAVRAWLFTGRRQHSAFSVIQDRSPSTDWKMHGGQTEEFSNMKFTPALVLVACLISASPALAHAHLKAETPPADAVLAASPSALSLGFSEGLEIGLSGLILKGQDGRVIPTGGAVLAPNDDKKITVPLKGALSAGKYTVEWHALSKDGHATHGSYQFTVVP